MDIVDVRPASPADLRSIAAIYDEQVASSVSTFDVEPRPVEVWEAKLAGTQAGDLLVVAVDSDGGLLGYAATSAYRVKPAYAATRETSVYVTTTARGLGVGRALYDVLLPATRAAGTHLVVAVVALPNPASEALHVACGFHQVGVLPQVGRKFDRWIDTALYARVLGPVP